MIIAVLEGMTFERAAAVYGFNSRQAAEKAFKANVLNDILASVNFFGSQEIEEIKKTGNDIKAMREQWREGCAAIFR